MKISDEEVQAAITEWWKTVTINGRPGGEPAYITDMRAALKAAYTVRKARKAKKRAKPEWNGKFEVGKSYRTRGGERAEIEGNLSGTYRFHGFVGDKSNGRVWTERGNIVDLDGLRHSDDLIGPWED